MSRPVLLAVAHGSRDRRAQAAVRSLAAQVRHLAPGVDVRVAFLQHARPSLAQALAEARAVAGTAVTIVPLLLAGGYHLGQDIAPAAGRAGVPVAGPLGPDPRLVTALADALSAAGAPDGIPVVLAAAGSADPAARAAAGRQAALLAAHRRAPVLAGFASAGRPTVTEAVAALAGPAAGPVAVAAYLLAPGQFHGRLAATGASWVGAPLASHPAVAALVLDRYAAAGLGLLARFADQVAGQLPAGRPAVAAAGGACRAHRVSGASRPSPAASPSTPAASPNAAW
jgi:sirohydrochlorin ferrochelatase